MTGTVKDRAEALLDTDLRWLATDLDERVRTAWTSLFRRYLLLKMIERLTRVAFAPQEGFRFTKTHNPEWKLSGLSLWQWTDVIELALAQIGVSNFRADNPEKCADNRAALYLWKKVEDAAMSRSIGELICSLWPRRDVESRGPERIRKSMTRTRTLLTKKYGGLRLVQFLAPPILRIVCVDEETSWESIAPDHQTATPLTSAPELRTDPGYGWFCEVALDSRLAEFRAKQGTRARGRPIKLTAVPSTKFPARSRTFWAPSASELFWWMSENAIPADSAT
jgi:hypothetical protein